MALQLSIAARNAMLDALESAIGASPKLQLRTGAPPADCAAASTGTLLAEFTLGADWAPAASAGAKAFSPVSAVVAVATGTAGHFRLLASGGTCHYQGTVTATGGGGDITVVNTSIASGQEVGLSAWTITMPGA